jgi:hypothetical protein
VETFMQPLAKTCFLPSSRLFHPVVVHRVSALLLLLPLHAHASIFGEALDTRPTYSWSYLLLLR